MRSIAITGEREAPIAVVGDQHYRVLVPRRLTSVIAAAAAVGCVVAAFAGFKGEAAGLRGQIGNLSAPWLLIGLYAGVGAASVRRGAARGLGASLTALLAFYVVASQLLGDQLGQGGALRQLAVELSANRIYLVFGLCTGPVTGAVGAWLRMRK